MVSFSKLYCKSSTIEYPPVISVIVPVYNSARYLPECLDSILGQTLSDIEVICVDDGSTDESVTILQQYAQKDMRVQILKQENKGGGAARNFGITKATGKYVLFLDSDDFFDINYFETMYSIAEALNSDMTVCDYYLYDNKTGEISTPLNVTELHLPLKSPFCYTDVKDTIFHTVPLVVWNRLYRRDFIMDSELRFQEIFHYNDVYFCHLSLIMAKSVSLVAQPFIYYRVNQSTNTQSKTYVHPYDFVLALTAVKSKLVDLDVFNDIEKSFIHYALDSILYSEKKLRGYDCHSEIHGVLINQLFQEYGFSKYPSSYYYNKYKYFEYLVVFKSKPEDLEKNNIICHIKTAILHPIIFIQASMHLMSCTVRLCQKTGWTKGLKTIRKYF